MIFSFLRPAVVLALLFATSAHGAQIYDITNIWGSIVGLASNTSNGTTVSERYDQQLSPDNGYSIAASINNGPISQASLSVSALENSISFAAMTHALRDPLTGVSSQAQSNVEVEVDFTLNEATLLQVAFGLREVQPGYPNLYTLQASDTSYTGVSLTEMLDGGGTTRLYAVSAGIYASSEGIDQYGYDDGLFFQQMILPGTYRFNITGGSRQGSSLADGALNFVPVPEPASALLVVLGLAMLGRRRVCR